MGRVTQPERQPPRIILQTKSFRIVSKDCGEFEGKKRPNDIIIEHRTKNGMEEEHWGTLGEVSNRLAEPAWAACLHALFTELSEQTAKAKEAFEQLKQLQESQGPITVTVEARPVRPTMTKSERRSALAELLIEVAKTLTGEVTIPPSMPFDNRDNAVGLNLTPAVLANLHKMFPGLPYPLIAVQLIDKLLERSAEELQAASER